MCVNLVFAVLGGIASGAMTAVLGYAKSSTVESFDPKKALQTLVVGAVVGGVAGYCGMTYTQAYDYLLSVGAITLVEYVKKAILRKAGLTE